MFFLFVGWEVGVFLPAFKADCVCLWWRHMPSLYCPLFLLFPKNAITAGNLIIIVVNLLFPMILIMNSTTMYCHMIPLHDQNSIINNTDHSGMWFYHCNNCCKNCGQPGCASVPCLRTTAVNLYHTKPSHQRCSKISLPVKSLDNTAR